MIVGRAITKERATKKRSKNLIPLRKQKRLSAITLQGAIVKDSIFLLQYLRVDNLIVHQKLFIILGVSILFSPTVGNHHML